MSSPGDFAPLLPAAFVELGDGGVHSPQIKFTADDSSCVWNGFPVCIDVELIDLSPSLIPTTSVEVTNPITIPAGGGMTQSDWPEVYVPDALEAILAGYKLQVRVRGTFITIGIFGAVIVTNEATGNCFSHTQTGAEPGGVYDSGFQDCSASCLQMATLGHNWLRIAPSLSNSAAVGWQFTGWQLDTQWVASGATPPSYAPNQPFRIEWRPPCYVAQDSTDRDAGLYIALETDSCGHLTKTYQQVADAVNALGVEVTASILGGHGSDTARPDPSTSPPFYCADMAGAECTGSVYPPALGGGDPLTSS